ncbi:hypothetical protein K466DRAFT_586675 [Polyporus arcularius HHB13444]|uniref:Uncharacterized protein n=1 Tax=Polyporus arcularius HHB13444 TaxID=1314778 RepID=A0A5C3PCX1_9APHY|nr:hypothetical protein K466DRAFT_586675 [Polyporus arcularius HHB13444]
MPASDAESDYEERQESVLSACLSICCGCCCCLSFMNISNPWCLFKSSGGRRRDDDDDDSVHMAQTGRSVAAQPGPKNSMGAA